MRRSAHLRNPQHVSLLPFVVALSCSLTRLSFHRKLDKRVVQRRLDLMSEEGVEFVTKAHGSSASFSLASVVYVVANLSRGSFFQLESRSTPLSFARTTTLS
jgi:hypothetical protein